MAGAITEATSLSPSRTEANIANIDRISTKRGLNHYCDTTTGTNDYRSYNSTTESFASCGTTYSSPPDWTTG